MAAGRVVVASATQPVREVIEHGVNGLLFDFFDTELLVEHVVDVLGHPIVFPPPVLLRATRCVCTTICAQLLASKLRWFPVTVPIGADFAAPEPDRLWRRTAGCYKRRAFTL